MKNKLDDHLVAYQGKSIYDFDNKILLTWYPQRVLYHAKPSSRSLLELGLGHGYATNVFSPHFERHVVVEGSPSVIQRFRDENPTCQAEIVEAWFEAFDTIERFDVIVMGFILEHVENPLEILKRFGSFLAPGGKLFLAVPNADAMNRRLGHIAGLLADTSTLSQYDLILGHRRFYSRETLIVDIEQAGYKIERLEGIYLKPFTTSQIISLQLESQIMEALCSLGVSYPELSCGLFAEISII